MRIFLGCLVIYIAFSLFIGIACTRLDNDGRYLDGFKLAFIATTLIVVFFALIGLGVAIIMGVEI